MNAEFEEKEYEVPLNIQLLLKNKNIWTPGQVFEGNFGIDAALEISRHDFWNIVGYQIAPIGAILNEFSFGYVWRRLGSVRTLPTFKLNLFIQVKRPEGLKNRPINLKRLGLQSPYWRFEIKAHQQQLLNKLKRKLGNRVFVAYGCATFHKLADLYSHTSNGTLVENSTFVKIEKMNGHHKWVYDKPGSEGFAMSKPEYIKEDQNLFEEINSFAVSFELDKDDPIENLSIISNTIIELCNELNTETETNPIAKEIFDRYEKSQKLINSANLISYLNIMNFSHLTNTNWMVIK